MMKSIAYILLFIQLFSCATPNTTMKNELKELDKVLQEKRPDYYAKLQDPLTLEEITQLESKYGKTLPDDVKELYLWKNGQTYDCYKALVNNSMFEPLENVLNNAEESTGMIGYDFLIENWWNKDWLPIFSNGGGDNICYDMGGSFTGNKGQLVEFWHADKDRAVIAPDLPTFIGTLNSYYQETDASNFDGFFSISDRLSQFEKSFIVDKSIPKKY